VATVNPGRSDARRHDVKDDEELSGGADENDGDGAPVEDKPGREKRIRTAISEFVKNFTLKLWDKNDDGKLSSKEKRRRAVWRLILVVIILVVITIVSLGFAAPVTAPAAGATVTATTGVAVAGTTTSAAGVAWVTANGAAVAKVLVALLPLMANLSGHKQGKADLDSIGNVVAVLAQLMEVAS